MTDGLIYDIADVVEQAVVDRGGCVADARAVAYSACCIICQRWGGEAHWVPQTFRPARDDEIARSHAEGLAPNAISRRLAVSVSTVRRVVRRQSAGFGDDDWVIK